MNPDPCHYQDFFKFVKGKKKILDVGCGRGVFLRECIKRGHEAIGVEKNKSIPKDLNIIFSEIEDVGLHTFDIITFWDSFEHLKNPFEVINNLKFNDFIFIHTNNNHDIFNIISLLNKNLFKICFGFPEHLWNFSKKSMFDLLHKNGWEIIRFKITETPASRFTDNFILKNLIKLGYLFNKLIKGGKIGEYYIKRHYERF